MFTHLFYHQQTVDEVCASNSWMSIRDWFAPDDEVIVADVGGSLKRLLPLERPPKYLRYEQLRTDVPQERSYTYGLNEMMPQSRADWIFLWRSDYIYHRRYFPAVLAEIADANVVLPYEAFIGAYYCRGRWCRRRLEWLRSTSEDDLLAHCTVCPVYEVRDFAHFAIRREMWNAVGGMNPGLWGYGSQFPELYQRLMQRDDCRPRTSFDMIAFHQNHPGSFGQNVMTQEKMAESAAAKTKLVEVFGSQEAADQFSRMRQAPLRARRAASCYLQKASNFERLRERVKRGILNRLRRLQKQPVEIARPGT